ncbi:conserved protein of unknown function [Ectopseudomonas oleovorans]|uniref:Uncharacterized protein n=1 Tax=Ectopseudomonas oleovorans TaxID=301 RepID=A0A653B572_ECTOL|nr:conserved protein of unknown function [Pseudomonas oleovorans]
MVWARMNASVVNSERYAMIRTLFRTIPKGGLQHWTSAFDCNRFVSSKAFPSVNSPSGRGSPTAPSR